MPDNAEAHSHTIETNRNCTLEITNITASHFLVYPKVHMESGFPYSPPQPTLTPNNTEVCSFTKDDNTASGAAGVMTYDLYDMQNRRTVGQIAVMFSVPFDYNFYKNWLGIAIFPEARKCDEKLFEHMYKDKKQEDFIRHEADGSGITYSYGKLDIRATMNDEGSGIVKIEIYDKMNA